MKNKKRMYTLLILITFALLSVICVAFLVVGDAFLYQPAGQRATLAWQDLGPTPGAEHGYKPQGATFARGDLLLSNHWDDTKSRVYRIDPATLEITGWFDMPGEAVHTGGLAWDGEHLWACDYKSYKVYRLDLAESFKAQQAVVLDSFPAGLTGVSACCILEYKGRPALALSDWRNTKRTYILDHEKAAAGTPFADAVHFSYRNESFSQGLVFIDGHLYESENKAFTAVVNKLDLEKLEQSGNARAAIVTQFIAPGRGVEDMAWDGRYLWTTDEVDFRIYKTTLP